MGYPAITGRGPGKPRIGIKRKTKPEQFNDPTIELRSAHDVRNLRGCAYCAGVGWKPNMLHHEKQDYHGRCFAMQFGLAALLALPQQETDRLTIADIGGSVMKALLEQRQ